jgi:hypothetical protein
MEGKQQLWHNTTTTTIIRTHQKFNNIVHILGLKIINLTLLN